MRKNLMTTTETYTRSLKSHLIESVIIAVLLTGISYIVGFSFGWVTEVNPLEAFAVFTSYACTYLSVRQRRIQYVVGVVTTAAYCLLFAQEGLIASSVVNGYLVITLIYGWFRWKSDKETIPVRHVQVKWIPAYVLVTAVFYVGAVLISSAFGGVFVFWDGLILAGTILAQFLLDNKRIETWYIWVGVNIVSIVVYWNAELYIASFQYVFFLLNTAYGYYEWRKTLVKNV